MPSETDGLVSRLEDAHVETVGGWTFWRGLIDGRPAIVSKTMKGEANVAAATAIAVEHFHPAAIVNEGTAGGHDPQLHVYDIVLGTYAVNLGSFKTGRRDRGTGSNPLDWTPLDLLASEGSAGMDPNARTMRRFRADDRLLAVGRKREGHVSPRTRRQWRDWVERRVEQRARSHRADAPRVRDERRGHGDSVRGPGRERLGIPFLGIRVVSNNITNGGDVRRPGGRSLSGVCILVVKAYVRAPRG